MFTVSATFVAGPDANASRQRHAPLYGRLVAEEHLPAAHRDAVHQVSFAQTFILCACYSFFVAVFFILVLFHFVLVFCTDPWMEESLQTMSELRSEKEEEREREKKKQRNHVEWEEVMSASITVNNRKSS